ncbi:MAG: glycosyltransferase [Candidatus Gastranaerophilales bacterium]|nr:glycosyltransferase [Candidatus Gastranaerophilales bacterium]
MKITIITASYNYQDFIKEAIESVLRQTYTDWEYIIVDDGSSDNSLEIIESYAAKDNRIKLLTHPEHQNRGLADTLKFGIDASQGEYIAFLESDDIWNEKYLEQKILIASKNPSVGVIFNDVELFGDSEKIKNYDEYFNLFYKKMDKKTFPCNIFKDLLFFNFIPTFSCAMVKADVLKKCTFNISKDFQAWLDWALWLQLGYYNDFYYIPQKLTKWRIHNSSYINKLSKKCKNTNKMVKDFVCNVFCSEKNILKKWFYSAQYCLWALFLKVNRGLVKKNFRRFL